MRTAGRQQGRPSYRRITTEESADSSKLQTGYFPISAEFTYAPLEKKKALSFVYTSFLLYGLSSGSYRFSIHPLP